MYTQNFTPFLNSLPWSAAFALLPLLAIFVLLGGLRWQARWAAIVSLSIAVLIAVAVYRMPFAQALSGALEGAATGFFPIVWVGINAIWLCDLTAASGHFSVLSRAFASISSDQRVQAILIAFCFGALLEGLGGGGSPVAICAVILIGLGISPMKAAAACLIADTSPVAFGSLGLPITTLATLTKLPVRDLSAMVGRQTPVLAFLVPFILVVVMDGWRGLRELWLLASVAGISYASAQFVSSQILPVELVDIVSALVAFAACGSFLYFRNDSAPKAMGAPATAPRQTELSGLSQSHSTDRPWEIFRAFLPYVVVLIVVGIAQIGPVARLLEHLTSRFAWPGLSVVSPDGRSVAAATIKFEWIRSAGSLMLISGLITAPMLGISFRRALSIYLQTLHKLRWAIFTVCAVVALAFVMNLSGQSTTLGLWAAGARGGFAAMSPVIGSIGTALTGSDTSSNALFGVLQVAAARAAHLSEILLAAANSAGGVCGKAISPQNLAIAAVAVGVEGHEGDLFRKVIGWTLLMIAALSLLVYLQSTSVLSWMVP
ncbi:MAG: L-lactate permease [Acidipila sp.]|nr:L-lactate permease [Acidipila sp.]